MSDGVRIHKALADAGGCSIHGHSAVDHELLRSTTRSDTGVGQLVDPARDVILVNGRRIEATQRRLYLALAKPAGVTSTVSDRHAGTTVLDLVPPALRHGAARLYPVGRLDRDSEGLLLLTNDGAWAQRMLHPSHGIEREYAVAVDQPLSNTERRQLERGIEMEEGTARLVGLRPATATEIRRLSAKVGSGSQPDVWYRVTLRQGMKRQIRRMFSALGIPVRRLVRVRFGTLMLGDMAIGDVRPVSARERGQLEQLVGGPEVEQEQPGLIVSIDGPGGSGKSTVGARAASELGYRFCDTGVLYRGLTWLAMHRDADLDDPQALVGLVSQLELAPDSDGRYTRLLIDGREVTDELHTAEVDREVSRVSQHAPVRAALLPVQQALAASGRIIMAGRDIGTVVLPDANPKLYLDVSIAERARRRAVERGVADDARAVSEIEEELRRRDEVDSTREASPLRIPDGALRVKTDGLSLDETVAQVVDMIREAERQSANGD